MSSYIYDEDVLKALKRHIEKYNNQSLVCMSMKGKTNNPDKLLGSKASAIARFLDAPTLLVPESYPAQKRPTNLVKIEFVTETRNQKEEVLNHIKTLHNSKTNTLNIPNPRHSIYEKKADGKFQSSTIQEVLNENEQLLLNTIVNYTDQHKSDILVMCSRKICEIQDFILTENTEMSRNIKKLAKHILLILPMK